ncbi:MAG: hypothetical protein M0P66_18505 [Salinivirgaceae bacterium]|nr:hypothetical protein [Salinivirgaceae bacterium]
MSYSPGYQIKQLQEICDNGIITNFSFSKNLYGTYTFKLSLTNQKIDGELTGIDFTKYKLNIVYKKSIEPYIYVTEPILVKRKHMHSDDRLCLYHKKEFKWSDKESIALKLIPWTIIWIYFYEMWLKTGIWYGDEYKH